MCHDRREALILARRRNIPDAQRGQFWTLQRQEGEPLRDFVLRCWQEASGQAAPWSDGADSINYQREAIREGFPSPYRFGCVLRDMVGSPQEDADAVAIWQAHNTATGQAIFYAWDGLNIDGDGPTLAAFYDPATSP